MFSEVWKNSINILYSLGSIVCIHRTVDRPQASVTWSFQFHTIPTSFRGVIQPYSVSPLWFTTCTSSFKSICLFSCCRHNTQSFRVQVLSFLLDLLRALCVGIDGQSFVIFCRGQYRHQHLASTSLHFTSLTGAHCNPRPCYFQCAEQESPPPPPLIAYLSR
jgi:hypothetical protein